MEVTKVTRATKDRSKEERVAERMVGSHGPTHVRGDALVYAFTRANSGKALKPSLLCALHKRLRDIESYPQDGLELFYEAWEREHCGCRGKGKHPCPIPDLHDFACQMRGEQQLLEDETSEIEID